MSKKIADNPRIDMKEIMDCMRKFTDFTQLSKREVAHGSFGHLYIVCDAYEKEEKHCKKIVKIVVNGCPETVAKEIAIAQLLHDSSLTPNLHNVFHCKNYLFIIMDRYDMNLRQVASKLFQENIGPLKALEGEDFPWRLQMYEEMDLLEMFRLAYELGNKYDIIHGDLKPDQFLWRKADDKIVVTDFGFAGTSDGSIPALRGWTYLGICAHRQPLPPDQKDKVMAKMYKKYFNMFQLWTSLAFRPEQVTAVLRRDGRSYAYLSSQIYPFAKAHRFHIPQSVIEIFKMEENPFHDQTDIGVTDDARLKLIRKCRLLHLAETTRFPSTIRPFLITN